MKGLSRLACGLTLLSATPLSRAEVIPMQVELVAATREAVAGQPIEVALVLRPGPGHHCYWRYPGLVGVPTSLRWDLPPGWNASALAWPAPERVDMRGIEAHGYRREVLLLATLTPGRGAAKTRPGDRLVLRAQAGWMACSQRRCNPGFEDLVLSLPVVAAQDAPEPTLWKPRMEATRAALPVDAPRWQAKATIEPEFVRLTVRDPGGSFSGIDPGTLYFFSEDGLIASNEAQPFRLVDGRLEVELVRNAFGPKDPTCLSGILSVPGGWDDRARQWRIRVGPEALTIQPAD